MGKLSDDYIANHNALTQSTKGAAPGIQIMWAAALLTVFETIQSWVMPHTPKRMAQSNVIKLGDLPSNTPTTPEKFQEVSDSIKYDWHFNPNYQTGITAPVLEIEYLDKKENDSP